MAKDILTGRDIHTGKDIRMVRTARNFLLARISRESLMVELLLLAELCR